MVSVFFAYADERPAPSWRQPVWQDVSHGQNSLQQGYVGIV